MKNKPVLALKMKLIMATAIIAISSLAASGNATADPFEEFEQLIQNADTTRAIEIAQCAGVFDVFGLLAAAKKYGPDLASHPPERFDEIQEKQMALEAVIRAEVLARAAIEAGYDQDPEIQEEIKRLLGQRFWADQQRGRQPGVASEEDIRRYYDD